MAGRFTPGDSSSALRFAFAFATYVAVPLGLGWLATHVSSVFILPMAWFVYRAAAGEVVPRPATARRRPHHLRLITPRRG